MVRVVEGLEEDFKDAVSTVEYGIKEDVPRARSLARTIELSGGSSSSRDSVLIGLQLQERRKRA